MAALVLSLLCPSARYLFSHDGFLRPQHRRELSISEDLKDQHSKTPSKKSGSIAAVAVFSSSGRQVGLVS